MNEMKWAEDHLRMTKSLIMPGVLHLVGSSPYWTGMTMFRIQEFYESNHPELRDKVFTLERAIDYYASTNGIFRYADTYKGFNVPGDVLERFYQLYRGMLTDKETCLFEMIRQHRPSTSQYYLIGTYAGAAPGYLNHELAHAAYYLDKTYRADMDGLIEAMPDPDRTKIWKWLNEDNYTKMVFEDECQAYLGTNTPRETLNMFQIGKTRSKPFRDYFQAYMKKLIDQSR